MEAELMALKHFIRVFVDSDGTATGECCHYDGAGNLTSTEPLDPKEIAAMLATGLPDDEGDADPSLDLPTKKAAKKTKAKG
jgi:hypothetical protein